jgi:hypothetical protein
VGASPQVTDFNPGIEDNGLFWTIPIAPGMVDIDPGSGSARFVGRNLPVPDYGSFDNSIARGSRIPSRVDFEVTWTATAAPIHMESPAPPDGFDFVGDYAPADARITFACSHDGSDVVYRSDSDGQGNPFPAVVGTERNGVFRS